MSTTGVPAIIVLFTTGIVVGLAVLRVATHSARPRDWLPALLIGTGVTAASLSIAPAAKLHPLYGVAQGAVVLYCAAMILAATYEQQPMWLGRLCERTFYTSIYAVGLASAIYLGLPKAVPIRSLEAGGTLDDVASTRVALERARRGLERDIAALKGSANGLAPLLSDLVEDALDLERQSTRLRARSYEIDSALLDADERTRSDLASQGALRPSFLGSVLANVASWLVGCIMTPLVGFFRRRQNRRTQHEAAPQMALTGGPNRSRIARRE